MDSPHSLHQQHHQHYPHQQIPALAPSALPHPLPAALDLLVDRLNAASGLSPLSQPSQQAVPPVRALLVGTNEGAPLHRSFGSVGQDHGLSEEILCGIESRWATLPSSCPPHELAAAQAADAATAAQTGDVVSVHMSGTDGSSTDGQPPHPLIRPLAMGDEVRAVTAFYDACPLVHVHLAPLVVTVLATPVANIGAIRAVALPALNKLLHPVRRGIVISRRGDLMSGAVGGGSGSAGGGGGGAAIGPGGGAVLAADGDPTATLMQQAFAAGFQAGSSYPGSGDLPSVPTQYY